MKLYGYWRSSCSWRVRIALAFKQLEYESVPVRVLAAGGDQDGEAFRALNPMRQVPLLEVEDGGHTLRIAQSMAILEYLEERYPDPPLLPGDRARRATVRQLAEMVNSGIQPLQNLATNEQVRRIAEPDDARAWPGHWIAHGFAAIQSVAATSARRFLVGDAVSLADVCLVPQLYNAARFGVDITPYPTLIRVAAACEDLPAFRMAHPELQPDAGA